MFWSVTNSPCLGQRIRTSLSSSIVDSSTQSHPMSPNSLSSTTACLQCHPSCRGCVRVKLGPQHRTSDLRCPWPVSGTCQFSASGPAGSLPRLFLPAFRCARAPSSVGSAYLDSPLSAHQVSSKPAPLGSAVFALLLLCQAAGSPTFVQCSTDEKGWTRRCKSSLTGLTLHSWRSGLPQFSCWTCFFRSSSPLLIDCSRHHPLGSFFRFNYLPAGLFCWVHFLAAPESNRCLDAVLWTAQPLCTRLTASQVVQYVLQASWLLFLASANPVSHSASFHKNLNSTRDCLNWQLDD